MHIVLYALCMSFSIFYDIIYERKPFLQDICVTLKHFSERAIFRKHCRGVAVIVERENTWKSYM